MSHHVRVAIGLMSGTSMDGIDAAMIRTDGEDRLEVTSVAAFEPYDTATRTQIRDVLAGRGSVEALEEHITHLHAALVNRMLKQHHIFSETVDVIGFHGHTIFHSPKEGQTKQIGNGTLLAELTGINVVYDFRSNDVRLGGEGAPLVPVYHRALALGHAKPIVIVNLGGIANVTWIGNKGEMMAFDTGPGNALMDDWMFAHTGKHYDAEGAVAAQGENKEGVLQAYLAHPYFMQKPPKSLDRQTFTLEAVRGLSLNDGMATLLQLTVQSIVKAARFFPKTPTQWVIAGGGRRNKTLMQQMMLSAYAPVHPIETLGYDGDMIEAQAFAYLAVRSMRGLPLTFPETTGVPLEAVGGVFCPA